MTAFGLFFLLAATAGDPPSEPTVYDFSSGDEPWRAINDTVMGGRSSGEMRVVDGKAVFSGTVSLENGGGFASVRSLPDDHDLSGYAGVSIRLRGDGKRYGLRLKTDRGWDGVNYQAPLETVEGEWTVVRVAFGAFRPVFRGRPVPRHPALDPASIKSFGLIVSGEQAGPFRLEIDWIRAWATP